MKLEDKLFLVTFNADTETHLGVKDQAVCAKCENKPCITGCPADCWELEQEHHAVHVAFEGCLECGTCRIICPHGNVKWVYPRGGFGVKYKHG